MGGMNMNLHKYSIRVGGLLCMTICLYVYGMQGQQISPDQQSNRHSLRVEDISQPDDAPKEMAPTLFTIQEEENSAENIHQPDDASKEMAPTLHTTKEDGYFEEEEVGYSEREEVEYSEREEVEYSYCTTTSQEGFLQLNASRALSHVVFSDMGQNATQNQKRVDVSSSSAKAAVMYGQSGVAVQGMINRTESVVQKAGRGIPLNRKPKVVYSHSRLCVSRPVEPSCIIPPQADVHGIGVTVMQNTSTTSNLPNTASGLSLQALLSERSQDDQSDQYQSAQLLLQATRYTHTSSTNVYDENPTAALHDTEEVIDKTDTDISPMMQLLAKHDSQAPTMVNSGSRRLGLSRNALNNASYTCLPVLQINDLRADNCDALLSHGQRDKGIHSMNQVLANHDNGQALTMSNGDSCRLGLNRHACNVASCTCLPVLPRSLQNADGLENSVRADLDHAQQSRFMDFDTAPAQAMTFDSHTSQCPNGNSNIVLQHSRRCSAHDVNSLIRSKRPKPPLPLDTPLKDVRLQPKKVLPIRVILSIDGGGSRGIIPLTYLREMERLLDCQGCKFPVDMVAGTSVGALVGCALLLNKMPDLYDNYERIAEQVFRKNYWSLGGFWGPAYYSDGRKQVIAKILGDRGMDALDNKFMAPFFSLRTNETLVGSNFGENANMYGLLDLLMMTTAAPTYFDPHVCQSNKGVEVEGADGGIFANHPGMLAYRAARVLYPNDKIVMISLGTGACHTMEGEYASQRKGMVYWAKKFSEISLVASSNDVNAALFQLSVFDKNFKYIRIQPSLEKGDLITDGKGHVYIKRLRDIALNSISEFSGGPQHTSFAKAVKKLKRRMAQD